MMPPGAMRDWQARSQLPAWVPDGFRDSITAYWWWYTGSHTHRYHWEFQPSGYGSGWESLGNPELSRVLQLLIETKTEWMEREHGLTVYARENSGPWCVVPDPEPLPGGYVAYSRGCWHFLSWVPGWPWSRLTRLAAWRASREDHALGEMLVEVLQLTLEELEATEGLLLLEGDPEWLAV